MANTDLINANGTISWASGLTGGTDAPEEDRCFIARNNLRRASARADRPGGLSARVTVGPWEGRVVLGVYNTDDGQPPLPTSTVGTLRVQGQSGQYYQFKVVLLGLAFGYETLRKAEPQVVLYDAEVTSTATSDTVTRVTP
jgi:hypothetical protein